MPTTILASRYNTLRNDVNLVLGQSSSGTANYGYGQRLNTSAKTATSDKVSAQDYEDLYIDLIRARSHQVGAAVTINEFVVGDYDTNAATADKIEEAYVIGLESLATNLITDRFLVDSNNLRLTNIPAASSTRLSSAGVWNGTISHIFTMTFTNAAARRHFFNSGSQIRLSASVADAGSNIEANDWKSILNSMGSTSFNRTQTTNNAGIGSGSNIGYDDLTTSYQLIYSRTSSAVYATNEYRIFAAKQSTNAVIFKVEFFNGAATNPPYGINEPVSGTFNSIVQAATADSSVTINGTAHDAVVLADPTGLTTRPLS